MLDTDMTSALGHDNVTWAVQPGRNVLRINARALHKLQKTSDDA
jgi:hypothetical protein